MSSDHVNDSRLVDGSRGAGVELAARPGVLAAIDKLDDAAPEPAGTTPPDVLALFKPIE